MVQNTKRISQHCQQLFLISQLSSSLILQRPFLHEWDYMWGFYCSTLTRMQPRLSWTLKAASCQFVKVWKVPFSNTHVGNILWKKKSCCWCMIGTTTMVSNDILLFLSAFVHKVKSAIPGASRCFTISGGKYRRLSQRWYFDQNLSCEWIWPEPHSKCCHVF